MRDNLQIEDIDFITGSTQELEFSLYDRYGDPLDVRTAEVRWVLSYLGQSDYPIITKTSKTNGGITIVGTNVACVTISPQDTINLYDQIYEHSLVVIQANGKILIPNYGLIRLKRCINYN